MLQQNKIINLRYITKPVSFPQPNPSNFKGGTNAPAFIQAEQQYTRTLQNPNTEYLEPVSNAVQLLADTIDYSISLGAGIVMGLQQSDFAPWYMKPVMITIKGISIVSSNPMIASDNIILSMYQKLKANLSSQNYNYYNKPLFYLYVENGFQDFNEFKGVIHSFDFGEKADYPNKFDYTIKFEGNPYSLVNNGFDNLMADINNSSVQASKPSPTKALLNNTATKGNS